MMVEGGPVMIVARRLAQLCLPHFEWEEKTVYPVLALLPDIVLGKLQPQFAKVMPLLEEFNMRQAEMDSEHLLILSAIDLLSRVAFRMKNADCADLASRLTIHETVEEKVIFPMVAMIGDHLRERREI
ncbi:MAG: hypothetical protein JWN94_3845 [Betaproteobacteria bacterium]|nr:hypothetical protein [Betaproteobacteria bacterium]